MRADNASAPLPAPLTAPSTWQRIAIGFGIALLGVVYLATLRSGQPWGDDFAMYIIQARNIADGHWFGPTGVIYNPRVVSGPTAYPPVFPVLLAPLYRVWGMSLTPMKVEVVLFFLAALYLIFEFMARQTPFPWAAGIVAVFGLSPYFWELKESIVSDLPFLFFSMLALCVIAACERQGWQSSVGACCAAACAYLCFATRTAGVVLLASLAAAAMPQPGVWRRKAVLAAAGAAALIAIHGLVFRGAGSYLDYLHAPWRALVHNLMAYAWNLRNSFFGVGGGVFGWLFLLVLTVGGAVGLVMRLRERVSPAEAFTLSYGLLVLVWASDEDLRFLIPLLPLWFLYIAVALRRLPARTGAFAGLALCATAACGYAVSYAHADTGPIRDGLGDPAFVRVCDYIGGQTPQGSVFLFAKPRLLALVTGRPTAAYHQPASDAELWAYFRRISAGYVLVNREFPGDRDYLEPLLLRNPAAAHEAYSQSSFHLYTLP
jgi:hypothetical protein